ncbi:MAG: GNAT family protein [Cyanobacteria bacterium P01_H01_bin.74]
MKILQLHTHNDTTPFQSGMKALLVHYQDQLLDTLSAPTPDDLLHNTLTCMPYLWVVVPPSPCPLELPSVLAIAALADILPKKQANIHGIAHPALRRHAIMKTLRNVMFQIAREHLGLKQINATVNQQNKAAKGFCWQAGFQYQATMLHYTLQL